ncbi:MAG TPA: M20/M25/M40 family metallo-hydrolase [Puia sp.]|jgi:aminopeptidase YwaD|nr:M20/M25/M40 family metallo-hydrolase [Puia sp.]
MTRSILLFLIFFQVLSPFANSQKLRKADKEIISELQADIGSLTNDKMEGRRSGTSGEALASDYIIGGFIKAGLKPLGDSGTYLQRFEIYDGRDITHTRFSINNADLILNTEFIPLPFSAIGKADGSPAIALQESGSPWFYDLKETVEAAQSNPHFDMDKLLREKTRLFEGKGATAVIFYNSSKTDDGIVFDPAEGIKPEKIPVLYVTKAGRKKYLRDISQSLDVVIDVQMLEKKRWGHNVIGFLDLGAPYTVVIGAHYDHLGYGEDGNSLYRGAEKKIHPGADDNASGTAALMELARLLKKTKNLRTNYLFIAFSGEESGLIGSKYFTEHPSVALSKISYMVNMDMVGRLNDSTHVLTIGGYGTSPQWATLINGTLNKKLFVLNADSSGTGPSDHTSFYLKNIPVLFFFTGIHPDYHKPTDQPDKINYVGEMEVIHLIYDITQKMDGMNKPVFVKTRDKQFGVSPAFNVTLGLMPDYSFSGSGLRIDAISEGRPAEKAGLKAGDIIIKLGDYSVISLQTYMEALSKFNRGDQTTVEFLRDKAEMKAAVQFK